MISFLLKMLGDPNEKKVKKILGIIDHINSLEPEFEKLTDEELKAKTDEFKSIIAKRPTSDNPKADKILEKERIHSQNWIKNAKLYQLKIFLLIKIGQLKTGGQMKKKYLLE